MKPSTLNLSGLVDFARHIESDGETSLAELQHRDREIGIAAKQTSKLNTLLWWLNKMEERKPLKSRYRSTQNAELRISFWMCIIGSLVGVTAITGLLMVENQRPVNVLLFLTLFIGSQLLLICITLLLTFTPRSDARLNFFPFEYINPARIFFRRSVRRLSKDIRWEYFSEVSRLALLRWGQIFGIAFNSAAIVAFLVILLFTDRSFGWSSTLSLSDTALYNFTDLASLPWQLLMPDARVSLEIISNTRYQSLQAEFSPQQLLEMRQWWPFLLGCIITYGLLPRIILFMVFHFKYSKSLADTFQHYPGARLILDRMNTPSVETKTENTTRSAEEHSKQNETKNISNSDNPIVINWTRAIAAKDEKYFLSGLGIVSRDIFTAGINLAQSKEVLDDINNNYEKQKNIVVAVKSWEPPLQELRDFLTGLNPSIYCELLLVPLADKKITRSERDDWCDFFVGDKQVKIILGGELEKQNTNESTGQETE